MNKELNISVSTTKDGMLRVSEEIRTGTLPQVRQLLTLTVMANILAPNKYLFHMDTIAKAEKGANEDPFVDENVFRIDRSLTHALIDLKEQRIRLNVNKNKEYDKGYQAIIGGQLSLSGDLSRFNINEEEVLPPRKLADKLKRLRIFFKDVNQNHEVVNKLMNLVGKTTKDFDRAEDNRGNFKASIDKKVTTNLPEAFTLCLPLFEGFAPVTFQVEIGIEDRDGGMSVWLESAELFSLLINFRDEIIHAEVKRLEAAGILCIIQNPDAKE